jgi:hypothetical protein
VRVGDLVTMRIPTGSCTVTTSNSEFNAASGSIPARFVPPQNLATMVLVEAVSANTAGCLVPQTNGAITVWAGPSCSSTFGTTGSAGWSSATLVSQWTFV